MNLLYHGHNKNLLTLSRGVQIMTVSVDHDSSRRVYRRIICHASHFKCKHFILKITQPICQSYLYRKNNMIFWARTLPYITDDSCFDGFAEQVDSFAIILSYFFIIGNNETRLTTHTTIRSITNFSRAWLFMQNKQ